MQIAWHLKGGLSLDEYLDLNAMDRGLILRALNWHIEKHNESLEG